MSKNRFNHLNAIPTARSQTTTSPATASASSRRLSGAMVVQISQLVPNTYQVRQIMDEEALTELAADIGVRGILEPLLVRENADGNFEVVAGQRRLRAAQIAGLLEVPVIVREMDDDEARITMLVENLQREDLDPKDERRFFQELMNRYNLSQEQIAKAINKSRGYVRNRLDGNLQGRYGRNSEKSNKMASQASSVSQETSSPSNQSAAKTTRPLRFEQPFVRFFQAVEKTLAQDTPDAETKSAIKARIDEMRLKLSELEAKIEQNEARSGKNKPATKSAK